MARVLDLKMCSVYISGPADGLKRGHHWGWKNTKSADVKAYVISGVSELGGQDGHTHFFA